MADGDCLIILAAISAVNHTAGFAMDSKYAKNPEPLHWRDLASSPAWANVCYTLALLWPFLSKEIACEPPAKAPMARDVRDLIRKMSGANPGWGAPRIHGELLKLGIDIGETTVACFVS
jgi:hypothetical protein